VLFPYKQVVYFDQIHPSVTFSYSLSPLPSLFYGFGEFHYAIFINTYNVLRSNLPPITFFFPPLSLLLVSPLLHLCHIIFLRSRFRI
jgi:hypothetical protein